MNIGTAVGVIIIGGAINMYLSKSGSQKKNFKSEEEYKEFCEKKNYIYLPNEYIRKLAGKESFPKKRKGFKPSILVNIGFLDQTGVWDSLRELAETEEFEKITFMQHYGNDKLSYPGVAYAPLTKETIKGLTTVRSDGEFFTWLGKQEQFVVDSYGKEVDPTTITNIGIGYINFGLTILKKVNKEKLTDLLLGQGYIVKSDIDQISVSLPRLKKLRLNFIESKKLSNIELLIYICENLNIDELVYNEEMNVDPNELKSSITRNIKIEVR